MTETNITGASTMQDVLEAYPSAQRALFQKYHIGGCSSCGYRPDESLESVAKNHGIQDVSEVLTFLETSAEQDAKMKMSPQQAQQALAGQDPPKLLDVRSPEEHQMARIDGAQLFTQDLNMEMAGWPRDTAILFMCHDGHNSMNAASFFAGHQFTNVSYLEGGIDAWSREIDKTIPRYQIDRDPATQQGVIRPLNESFS